MDKKSANGYPTAGGEGGGGSQRKQLPYSVETPYGFHLDLDFLKYVDDIEKGNTIKRVHIQRKARGPPKFSTLPRNFSLPGHGARPVPKDTWSSTSTLGPKPRGRVNEVQQIFDFRPSDGDTTQGRSQSGKALGCSLASARPKDETGARGKGEQPPERPNLLRTSSMPVTIPHRKGSESGDEKTDNGSSENVFRSVPQDRLGLHQQITAALKRVRELEDMVRTIPELKSQICSLREEREQLILRLQAQTKPQAPPPPPPQRTSPSPAPRTQAVPTSQAPESGVAFDPECTGKQQESLKSEPPVDPDRLLTAQKPERQAKSLEEPERQAKTSEAPVYPLEHRANKQTDSSENVKKQNAKDSETKGVVPVIEGVSVYGDGDLLSTEQLQARLVALEAKLSEASEDLERTNSLLRQQVEENRVKEEMILQLSESGLEGVEFSEDRLTRRVSVDQQTETERADMVEQGTETESIIICLTRERGNRVNHMTETERFASQERLSETEMVVVCPTRPRANSVERGTETERVDTVDQVTETPPEVRLDQVTEMPTVISVDQTTETTPVRPARPARHTVNNMDQATETHAGDGRDHSTETPVAPVRPARPARPRTGSVDRGTETERVGTVDQVTETMAAQRADQQTETDRDRAERVGTVDQVTETVAAQRADQQTETDRDRAERVGTVDQVTETVAAQRADQQTETDRDRAENSNNPHRALEIESAAIVSAAIESAVTEIVGEDSVVSGSTVPDILVTESAISNGLFKDYDITESAVTEEGFVVIDSVGTGHLVSENVGTDIMAAEGVAGEGVAGEGVAGEGVAPESVAPETVAPETVAPESVAAESVAAESVAPESVAPESVAPEIVAPEIVAPEIVAPESVAPESVAPESVAPESVVKKTQVCVDKETVVEKTIVTENDARMSTSTDSTVTENVITENVATEIEVLKATVIVSTVVDSVVKVVEEIETPCPESPARTPSSSQLQIGQKNNEHPQSQDPRLSKPALDPAPRRGSNPALGQVVTRLTGLINEQWAQLGSSQDKQETPSPSAQKTAVGQSKVTTGKSSVGKSGTSKMSSIQSQLVSSLSALSAFYSPGQKATASKQQGLKSIMKKKDATDKQGNNGGAKKNLKFVGINGGYETTSSEESSGEEKDEAEEVDSSEPDEQQGEQGERQEQENQGEATVTEVAQGTIVQVGEAESEGDAQDPETSQALLEEQPAAGEMMDKAFMEACDYIKDRMAEVATPNVEMRQALTVLYQVWFGISSQKDSQADTVTLYLREVGLATPTLLRFIVNLADGNGNTALHYSVSHSNFAVVKLLLDTGLCEADIQNKAGYTAVMLASLTAADRPEDMEVALQLLRQGDVNARASQAGQTALMLSVSHGRTAMVRLLLSCQADVNVQDKDGSTALMCACEHGHTEIARILLESGNCDAGLTDKNGQSAISVAVMGSHTDLVDLLKTHLYSTTPSATIITTTTASLL